MDLISGIVKNSDPLSVMYNGEFEHIFLSFCSFICIINNKKMNLANIFILLMSDESVRNLYKTITEIDNDYEALKSFLQYDQTLYKSKYIKNFLNNNKLTF